MYNLLTQRLDIPLVVYLILIKLALNFIYVLMENDMSSLLTSDKIQTVTIQCGIFHT